MSEQRWQPGEVILMEEYLERTKRQLINVRPQVVVEDSLRCLAIVSLPGMTWMTRDIPGRTAMTPEERIPIYIREELGDDWYERKAGDGAVLTIHEPGVSRSIRLFWGPGWSFRMWYVNLEDPYVRVDSGIQVNDHTLDVVATPDFEWAWKDEPEFAALIEAGKIPLDKARAIREEGERAISRIEAREWPFNEPWPEWRPDPSWKAPEVKDLWTPPAR
jgi:hypothetical protein